MHKRALLKKLLSPILTVIVLVLFGIYLYKNPEILTTVLSINIWYVVIAMIFFLLLFFVEGIFIKITLDIFNKHIDLKEAYYLSTLSRIGNYLLPLRAGAIFRATYLKKKYNFEYSKFLSTLYAYYILLFLLNSAIAIISLSIKYLIDNQYYPLVSIFFIAIFLGTIFVILFRKTLNIEKIKVPNIVKKFIKTVNSFITSWDMIVRNRKHFLSLLLVTFANIFLNGVVNLTEFISLGLKVNILDIILYTCLSGVSLLVSITPGSLGLREAVFLITSQSIGLTQDQIMQLAFLDRGIMFVLLLLLLIGISLFVKRFNLKELFFAKKDIK